MNFQTKSIVAVILVLGSLVVGYFVLLPRWSAYSQAKTSLATAQDEQSKLKDAQSQLTSFLNDYKQHADDAKLINDALPLNQEQFYNVLNNLDVLSKQSGITVGSLTTVATGSSDQLGAQPGSIQPISISMSVTGSYPAFKEFLGSLESNLRIIDVNSLTLSSDPAKSGTYALNFTTYYEQ